MMTNRFITLFLGTIAVSNIDLVVSVDGGIRGTIHRQVSFGARPTEIPSAVERAGEARGAAMVNANPRAFEAIVEAAANGKPMLLRNFPLGPNEEESTDLEVIPFSVFTPDAKTLVQRPNGDYEYVTPTVQMLRGRVSGNPLSSVILGFTETGVTGFIETEEDLVIAAADNGVRGRSHIYNTKDVDIPISAFEDKILEVEPQARKKRHLRSQVLDEIGLSRREQTTTQACYTIAIDALDGEFGFMSGSATDKMNYLTILAATSSVLFAGLQDWQTQDYYVHTNEFQIYLSVGAIVISSWYSPKKKSDCFNSPIDANCLLGAARNYWVGSGSPNIGPYHALITMTGKCGPWGGIAYGNTVCDPFDWRYGLAGCLNGNFPGPTATGIPQSWDVINVCHELGHVFGAPHTHDIGIDTCDSTCVGVTDGSGTVMSYCHRCGGVSKIAMRFHQDIIADIAADRANDANCVAGLDTADMTQCENLLLNIDLPSGCTVDNCLTCDTADTSACIDCEVGFFVDASQQCAACNSNCLECTATECTTCAEEFYIQGNQCIECITISTGCVECTATGGCTACAEGYDLVDDACVPRPTEAPSCAHVGWSCHDDVDCCSGACSKGNPSQRVCL